MPRGTAQLMGAAGEASNEGPGANDQAQSCTPPGREAEAARDDDEDINDTALRNMQMALRSLGTGTPGGSHSKDSPRLGDGGGLGHTVRGRRSRQRCVIDAPQPRPVVVVAVSVDSEEFGSVRASYNTMMGVIDAGPLKSVIMELWLRLGDHYSPRAPTLRRREASRKYQGTMNACGFVGGMVVTLWVVEGAGRAGPWRKV